ncbi:hypothetical protein TNCV_2607551 [Trichonephila clavipes]|uniref:Uncharacterized protein n=1 Tax=Trichonephila clavipes TaxID=2585209 RepID=A0A8X6RVU2_TRICX|nr:hypothetical protein TNCV_2607551 [Trichonephila clavipes]
MSRVINDTRATGLPSLGSSEIKLPHLVSSAIEYCLADFGLFPHIRGEKSENGHDQLLRILLQLSTNIIFTIEDPLYVACKIIRILEVWKLGKYGFEIRCRPRCLTAIQVCKAHR